ncbi:Glutamate-1-semialdehyde 2,1-aminomutase [bacterium HR23]|nr:Glutamate-1-semialdehyde 2,1-aminomutase [bacterium HR23]
MLSRFFTTAPVENWEGVQRARSDVYRRLFHALLERGVYFAPSPYEALFLSLAHTEEDVGQTVEAVRQALFAVRGAL